MTSAQNPYDDAYRDADGDNRPARRTVTWCDEFHGDEPVCQYGPGCPACAALDEIMDAGQGRTLAEVNASARVVEVCIVAALLLAALVWVVC